MKKKIICLIVISVLISLNYVYSYAHGLLCTIEYSNNEKILINVYKDPDYKGNQKPFNINYNYVENGKSLYIGYEFSDTGKNEAKIVYDIRSLIMPIRVVLKNINNDDSLFNDIYNNEAEDYILHLHGLGIVNGRTENEFKPYENVTRAEFIVMILRALGTDLKSENEVKYKDIKGHWAEKYINKSVEMGFINGYKDNTIRPNNKIKLSEVCAVVIKAFDFKTKNDLYFSKLRNNMWYSDYVNKIFDLRILTAQDSIYEEFDEEENVNRGLCSMIISRALTTL